MSSSFYKSQNLFDVKPAIRIVVKALQEELAEYVQGKMTAQNLSTHDVARRSGGLITHATVWNVANARVRDVKPDTLRALAKGLSISEDEIFAVARGKSLEPMSPHDFYSALEALGVEQFSAYGGVQNLSAEDQQEIISMIEAMVVQKLKRKKPNPAEQKKKR